MEGRGCVHLYTGDGKGKTTAAVGLAARAAGCGLRVGFYQFMKTGESGELAALGKLGVQVVSPPAPGRFVFQMDEAERADYAARQREILRQAARAAPRLDLLVLDEAVCAAQTALLEEGALEAFVKEKPAGLELVLTGRGAGAALVKLADYVTEMRALVHPYDKGQAARQGIEY